MTPVNPLPAPAAGFPGPSGGAPTLWREPVAIWAALAVAAVLLYAAFSLGLGHMVRVWNEYEEYSFGYLVPLITLFLIWQRKDVLRRIRFEGSWLGPAAVLGGGFGLLLANLSTITVLEQYAFLLTLFGIVLSLTGWTGFKVLAVPLAILVFMIPLPLFMMNQLSEVLQLVSSEIGVMVIRLFGISVFLDGNVIDLGIYKLQVADACSGLRYLFPLMTLGFIAAYLYNAALWKRAVIFLVTIPLTVLMNSVRIGIIGVTVNQWGIGMAEGFLHFFEGWIIFMACMVVLLALMWLLLKIGPDRKPLREAFVLEAPAPVPPGTRFVAREVPKTLLLSLGLVAAIAVANQYMPQQELIKPQRKQFLDFPLAVEGWQGTRERLSQVELDVLQLDDYIYANYRNAAGHLINFYVAYYDIQARGASATHSPRSCMPGGGWNITDFGSREVAGLGPGGGPLHFNRAVIKKDDRTQIVYYWFQQRGRNLTNEYAIKWYIFWDGLTRQRTDGAMIRFVAPKAPGELDEDVDRRMVEFMRLIAPRLGGFIPD